MPETESWTVLRYEDGAASRLWECDSAAEAAERMSSFALRDGGQLAVAVGHAGSGLEAAADRLAHELALSDSVAEVERYRVGASVGADMGPDSFGFFWWPAS